MLRQETNKMHISSLNLLFNDRRKESANKLNRKFQSIDQNHQVHKTMDLIGPLA